MSSVGALRLRSSVPHLVLHVHQRAVGKLVEQFDGNLVTALRIGEGQQHRVIGRFAGQRAMEASSHAASFWRRSRKAASWVVGDIVAAAHEGIDGAQRLRLRRGRTRKP